VAGHTDGPHVASDPVAPRFAKVLEPRSDRRGTVYFLTPDGQRLALSAAATHESVVRT